MEEKKKYYWIKLKTDFFDENTIDWLMSQKNGCEYVVLYQMLCLKTANSNGSLTTKIGEMIVPYDVEKIVRDTKYFDSDTVIVALELYKKLGLIYENKEGLLTISNYTMMVGSESASKEAVKKREYRNRLKAKEAIQLPEHTEKIGKKKDIEVDKKGTNCPTEIRDKRLDIRDKNIDIEKDKEKEKKETFVSIVSDYSSNETLISSLNDFVDMRKKMKGFTTRALKLNLKRLDELAVSDDQKIDIVNASIENGWKSFYPLKNNSGYSRNSSHTVSMPSYWTKSTEVNEHEEDPAERVKRLYDCEKKLLKMGEITHEEFDNRTANYIAMYRDLTGKEIE